MLGWVARGFGTGSLRIMWQAYYHWSEITEQDQIALQINLAENTCCPRENLRAIKVTNMWARPPPRLRPFIFVCSKQ